MEKHFIHLRRVLLSPCLLYTSKGITVLNTPGTIDADYTNEIGIILINNGYEAVYIEDGERIAQLVFTLSLIHI